MIERRRTNGVCEIDLDLETLEQDTTPEGQKKFARLYSRACFWAYLRSLLKENTFDG